MERGAIVHLDGPDSAIGIAAVLRGQPVNGRAIGGGIKELVVDAAIDLAFHTTSDQLGILGTQVVTA
jgi:hypothetical protein